MPFVGRAHGVAAVAAVLRIVRDVGLAAVVADPGRSRRQVPRQPSGAHSPFRPHFAFACGGAQGAQPEQRAAGGRDRPWARSRSGQAFSSGPQCRFSSPSRSTSSWQPPAGERDSAGGERPERRDAVRRTRHQNAPFPCKIQARPPARRPRPPARCPRSISSRPHRVDVRGAADTACTSFQIDGRRRGRCRRSSRGWRTRPARCRRTRSPIVPGGTACGSARAASCAAGRQRRRELDVDGPILDALAGQDLALDHRPGR